MNGVQVRTQAEWGQREPPGTGDLHHASMRGGLAELRLEHGPHTNFKMELELHGNGHPDLKVRYNRRWRSGESAFPG